MRWRLNGPARLLAAAAAVLVAAAVYTGSESAVVSADDGPEAAAEWVHSYGGSLDDRGYSVQQTSDGGYEIVGVTESEGAGGQDVYMVKTSPTGIQQWETTYGGSSADEGWSVQQTSDGGYIIAGSTHSKGAGGYDVWLIKTDAGGNLDWDATFGGAFWDRGHSVQQTLDGGYIVAGSSYSSGTDDNDVYLVKANSDGSLDWEATFGGSSADEGWSVRQTVDGGYIVIGSTYSAGAGSSDVYLVKAKSDGSLDWEKTFGGSSLDAGRSVQQTPDGGYIIAGATYSKGAGDYDVWLIKTDSGGAKQWDKTFGGVGMDWGYSVLQTSDGGYVIAGESSSSTGGPEAWVIRTGSGGSKLWDQTFGGSGYDRGYLVRQTSDRSYVVVGETSSYGAGDADAWLVRISNPPTQPENDSPSGGAVSQTPTLTLQSSAFYDPDSGDTHAASQWQVTTDSGDYDSPVFDSGRDTSHLGSITVPSGSLSYSTTYYWRVRHQDNHGAWSAYSAETSFTTTSVAPAQPVNETPADGATGITLVPALESSAFSDLDSEDTHAASQWQVTAVSGDYSACVFDSGRDTANLNSVSVPSGYLSYGSIYYWHVRHQDSQGNWSEYSSTTSFATMPVPAAPVPDFSATPVSGSPPLSVKFTDKSTGVITSWQWDFNSDGIVDSVEKNPTHEYADAGKYSVSLMVTGPGGSNTETKTSFIAVESSGGLGACACASLNSGPTTVDLMVGWTVTGLSWGTGYFAVRRLGKRSRK